MISLQPLGDPDAVACEGGVCALPDVTADGSSPDDSADTTAVDDSSVEGSAPEPPTAST